VWTSGSDAVFCFTKLLRDDGLESEPHEQPTSVVVPPPVPVPQAEDDELAAYNAYLARLNGE